TPLHWAAAKGNLEIVRYLLELGANTQAKNFWGETPAQLAEHNSHTAIAATIVSYTHQPQSTTSPVQSITNALHEQQNVESTAKKDDSQTPFKKRLRSTLFNGNSEQKNVQQLKQLLGNHPNEWQRIFAPNSLDANTAHRFDNLITAIIEGERKLVNRYLQEQNLVKLGIADPEGNTPLHWAAALGNTELVELLLGWGANTQAQNHEGLTPLGVALSHRHQGVIDILQASLLQGHQQPPLVPPVQIAPSQQQQPPQQGWLNWAMRGLGFGGGSSK
ncbi:MAG TPA: ankyrin repeat domain-containing protein, partial [Candidatus Babeliaceae bacterium]|nr:ankyrin repeat domain-containing protein [Candidatus Babeliaceae bacterium]